VDFKVLHFEMHVQNQVCSKKVRKLLGKRLPVL